MATTYAPSQKQLDYALALGTELAERATTPARETLLHNVRASYTEASASSKDMSLWIDLAKTTITRWRTEDRTTAPEVTTPEGMHLLNGMIFKVQRAVHGSGNLYAKKLVLDEPDCGGCTNGEHCETPCAWTTHFEYAPGVVRKLNENTRMSLEQAKEFGATYGTCCVCGRTLTDEGSIAAGIGPVCASKF